jgi:hypothetical protein
MLFHVGPLAQLAEQLTLNQLVEGSSPSRLTREIRAVTRNTEARGDFASGLFQ